MSLSSDISTTSTALSDIKTAIIAKGVTPSGNITTYATAIGSIQTEPTLASLTITPSTTAQTITPPSGTDGYNTVIASAVTASIDSDIVAGNIKSGVNILGVSGNVIELAGETKTVTPSTTAQTITPSTGKNGLTTVTVSGVTSSIDANITAGNIKKDVSILGVTGSYEGSGSSTLTTKTITANGTYAASSDNADGYSSVTVNVSGGGIGIPREVSAQGAYQMPTTSFTFSLPSTATDIKYYALAYAFYGCSNLTSIDLSNLSTITGNSGMSYTFYGCTGLRGALDLSNLITISGNLGMSRAFQNCSNITSVNLSNLTTLGSGVNANAMSYAFYGCTGLTSVDLSSLADLSGQYALQQAFYNCISLQTLSFPALKSTSFGSYTNQFNSMLYGVSYCTVHFPSNLQSVIGNWTSVKSGFNGTNTTVLFDLPATS